MKLNDLTGKSFDRWTVVSYLGKRMWACRCSCGREKVVNGTNLTSGKSRSCGCLSVEVTRAAFTKHGKARAHLVAPEYRSWQGMKDRCLNPNNDAFAEYGGRGVTVCDEWLDNFEAFFAHVGAKPGYRFSLDRIRVNEGYKPGNVRWATDTEQSRNRRNVGEVDGIDLVTLRLLSGVSNSTYHRRIRNGWAREDASKVVPRSKRQNGQGRKR